MRKWRCGGNSETAARGNGASLTCQPRANKAPAGRRNLAGKSGQEFWPLLLPLLPTAAAAASFSAAAAAAAKSQEGGERERARGEGQRRRRPGGGEVAAVAAAGRRRRRRKRQAGGEGRGAAAAGEGRSRGRAAAAGPSPGTFRRQEAAGTIRSHTRERKRQGDPRASLPAPGGSPAPVRGRYWLMPATSLLVSSLTIRAYGSFLTPTSQLTSRRRKRESLDGGGDIDRPDS